MTLIFENIKKKVSRKKYLEIDFDLGYNKKLLIVDENIDNLKNIRLLFSSNDNKYDGNIFLFGNNIKNKKKYFYFEDDEYGFYNDLTVYQNFNKILRLLKISIRKEEILNLFKIAKIENKKYSKLDTDSKKRCKLLFKYIVSKDIFIIDLYKYKNLVGFEEFYNYLINNNEYFKNRVVVVLSENINNLGYNCDKVLVLSDYKQVYYGDIETLNVIKELIIIEFSENDINNLNLEIDVDFKVIDNKIIVRKVDMEKVLYHLVGNNISILNINDFNENINIYGDEE